MKSLSSQGKRCISVVLVAAAAACPAAELEVKDAGAFRAVVDPEANLERLATGMQFTVGPS